MMELILKFYDETVEAIKHGATVEALVKLPIKEKIGRFKYTSNDNVNEEFNLIVQGIKEQIDKLLVQEEEV